MPTPRRLLPRSKTFAGLIGLISGLLFELVYLVSLFLVPPDPQVPIGIVVSPMIASLFGLGMFVAAKATLSLLERTPQKTTEPGSLVPALVLLLMGLGLVTIVVGFVSGEMGQAFSPVRYPAATSQLHTGATAGSSNNVFSGCNGHCWASQQWHPEPNTRTLLRA